jgi:hypothetical protein
VFLWRSEVHQASDFRHSKHRNARKSAAAYPALTPSLRRPPDRTSMIAPSSATLKGVVQREEEHICAEADPLGPAGQHRKRHQRGPIHGRPGVVLVRP